MLFEDGIQVGILKGAWYRGVGEHLIGRPFGDLWMTNGKNPSWTKGVNNYKHIAKELAKNPLYVIGPLATIMGLQSVYNYKQSLRKPSSFVAEISQRAFKRMLDNPMKTGVLAAGIGSLFYLQKSKQSLQDKG